MPIYTTCSNSHILLCRKQVKQLIAVLHDGQLLGPVEMYSAVIEFQQRNLPHLHMLLRLLDGPRVPSEYDKYVTAEIPPDTDPILRDTVLDLMTHLKHDKAGYPKPFCEVTRHEARKRPEYRRRRVDANGRPIVVQRKGKEYTNAHVVPTNPALLMLPGGFNGLPTGAQAHSQHCETPSIRTLIYIFIYV